MRVLGYVRVSTDEQGERGLGLAAQRSAIIAEAGRRGWDIVDVIEDAGWSGSDLKRPGMGEAVRLLGRGEADALVAAKLDRLSRSILDFAGLMADARKQGWNLVALDCAVDTTTPAGEAMANVMATFAQFERRVIAARTSEALRELRRQGRAYGPIPFGFDRVGDHLVLHEGEQEVVTRIKRLRARGTSYQRIAESLNRSQIPAKRGGRWHAMAVSSVLKTSSSLGHIRSGVA